MRIALLTTSVSGKGGGIVQTVLGLAAHLDAEVEVFTLEDHGDPVDLPSRPGLRIRKFAVRGPRVYSYAPGLAEALVSAAPDVLHLHGIWTYTSAACAAWAARTGRPYMISPHGMLAAEALRHSRFRKQLVWRMCECSRLRRAACLHALSESETAAIRRASLRNPVCTIPNGVEAAPEGRGASPAWAGELPPQSKVLLYLGRLHPIKGLDALLRAWSMCRERCPELSREWHLVIAGWGPRDYVRHIMRVSDALAPGGSVHFVGPQFGARKSATFQRAHAFALPSLSEALPLAVLEAWTHRLPVLMTAECSLPEGFSCGAAFRITREPDDLARGLMQLFELPDGERRAAGARGEHLVRSRFSWPLLASRMQSVYEWLAGRALQPDWVEAQPKPLSQYQPLTTAPMGR